MQCESTRSSPGNTRWTHVYLQAHTGCTHAWHVTSLAYYHQLHIEPHSPLQPGFYPHPCTQTFPTTSLTVLGTDSTNLVSFIQDHVAPVQLIGESALHILAHHDAEGREVGTVRNGSTRYDRLSGCALRGPALRRPQPISRFTRTRM